MRDLGEKILFSASDLIRFMGCRHATTLDIGYMRGDSLEPNEDSEEAALLQKQGDAHEVGHLTSLKTQGQQVIEIHRRDLKTDADATRAALTTGTDVV
jgi:hypothetical protein